MYGQSKEKGKEEIKKLEEDPGAIICEEQKSIRGKNGAYNKRHNYGNNRIKFPELKKDL